ncbi:MAG: pyruvate kinase [Burkholderiales bacterium]
MDLGWNPAAVPHAPELLLQLREVRTQVAATQERLLAEWRPHLELRGFRGSASNLAAYIELRRHDLRGLQRRLAGLGLTSLGRCDGHVVATLDAVIHALLLMQGHSVKAADISRAARSMERDRVLLYRNTNRLLGMPPETRWTRFMVTVPREAGADYAFVRELVKRGMDCARVNCAQDDKAVWRDIISNVRQAQKELGRSCKVLMELAGPKLRTGPVDVGPPVLHVKVKRDQFGDPLHPALIVLDGSGRGGREAMLDKAGHRVPARLAVDRKWLAKLEPGDRVLFRDLKGRKRELAVEARLSDTEVVTACADGAYIAKGTEIEHEQRSRKKAAKTKTGAFEAPPVEIEVTPGGMLLLTRDGKPGGPQQLDKRGRVASPAHIGCTEPAVFGFLEPGQTAWIDDGRVGGLIEKVDKHGAWLRITRARADGERIGADRSINFPDTRIDLPALSERDLAHLDVACKHADIVGLSFVKGAEDVDQLAQALAERNRRQLGIIAKIETRAAVEKLPDIIVHGAGTHPFGVMIARGDLAAGLGYERVAEVEENIRRLCAAAHVPTVWANQGLENLVKRDLPSRAEITEAAIVERSDCLMLNKGPYLLHALSLLETVVMEMQPPAPNTSFPAVRW